MFNSGKETLCPVFAIVPVYRWPYMLWDIKQRLLYRYVHFVGLQRKFLVFSIDCAQ